MLKIMTPGPTQVRENVRHALSQPCTNPDLDFAFFDFYQDTCTKLATILDASGSVYILDGEGILGLEAACASLTEPGDRVLIIDNGIYGKGFADFAALYGGQPVLYSCDDTQPIDPKALAQFLEIDHQFKYATIVHCDTPSGVLNDVAAICPLLKAYGILTVVDSVAASFGVPLSVAQSQIDICCCGSQKALSAPPGLTILTVSNDAMAAMTSRRAPIASFYGNILTFQDYYQNKLFPYTMPASDIAGLAVAVDNFLADPEVYHRHQRIAAAVRAAITAGGLSLYTSCGYADTVSAIVVPDGLSAQHILDIMVKDHGIMIAGSYGSLAGRVIRIGHMGENANRSDVADTLNALEQTLAALGCPPACNLRQVFLQALPGI